MNTYKLIKSGSIEFVKAKDFQQAERLAYGRVGCHNDRVIAIVLQDDKEMARNLAVAAIKSL